MLSGQHFVHNHCIVKLSLFRFVLISIKSGEGGAAAATTCKQKQVFGYDSKDIQNDFEEPLGGVIQTASIELSDRDQYEGVATHLFIHPFPLIYNSSRST